MITSLEWEMGSTCFVNVCMDDTPTSPHGNKDKYVSRFGISQMDTTLTLLF